MYSRPPPPQMITNTRPPPKTRHVEQSMNARTMAVSFMASRLGMAPGLRLAAEESVARFRWKGLGLVGPLVVVVDWGDGCTQGWSGMNVYRRLQLGVIVHVSEQRPARTHVRTHARTREHADVLEGDGALEEAEAAEDRHAELHLLLHLQGVGQREDELPL